MTHAQLVIEATDLLSEVHDPSVWLHAYDRALASSSDAELQQLLDGLRREIASYHKLAA